MPFLYSGFSPPVTSPTLLFFQQGSPCLLGEMSINSLVISCDGASYPFFPSARCFSGIGASLTWDTLHLLHHGFPSSSFSPSIASPVMVVASWGHGGLSHIKSVVGLDLFTASLPPIQLPSFPGIFLFPSLTSLFMRMLQLPTFMVSSVALQASYFLTSTALLIWMRCLSFGIHLLVCLGVLGCLASLDFPLWACVTAEFVNSHFFFSLCVHAWASELSCSLLWIEI